MHLEGMVKLKDPAVFSMSNLRHVVDRMVSGFFYTNPHSPHCAQEDTVVSSRVTRGQLAWGSISGVRDPGATRIISSKCYRNEVVKELTAP